MWYLYEEEVAPLTNADWIRQMKNDELAKFIKSVPFSANRIGVDVEKWLKENF